MKLVSDLKQYLILNDFPSVNEAIAQNSNMFKEMQVRCSMTSSLQSEKFVWLAEPFMECFFFMLNLFLMTSFVVTNIPDTSCSGSKYSKFPVTISNYLNNSKAPRAIKRISPLGLVRLGTFQLTQLPPLPLSHCKAHAQK